MPDLKDSWGSDHHPITPPSHISHKNTHTPNTPSLPHPSLPPTLPSPSPSYSLRRNGSESVERRRQADGTHRVTQLGGHHTHTHTHTHRHTDSQNRSGWKRHGASSDSSPHPGTVTFTLFPFNVQAGALLNDHFFILIFNIMIHLVTQSSAYRENAFWWIDLRVKVWVHVQLVCYDGVSFCSRNPLFRSFNRSSNKSPRLLCVSDQSHRSRLVMHVPVTPRYITVAASLAARRRVQCRAAPSRRQGIQQMCKYRMSWRLKRPSYVYWHSLQKKGTRVGFLSPVEEFSILEENVLSLSCWQVT